MTTATCPSTGIRFDALLRAVEPACDGLAGVSPTAIAEAALASLPPDAGAHERDEQAIAAAVMMAIEEPNYARVAARLLARQLADEAGPHLTFDAYLDEAVAAGLVAEETRELARTDMPAILAAIDHARDGAFEYFGLKTLCDRYLLRRPGERTVMERPQWLFMRVALGLSASVSEAVGLYGLMSTFRYMPATPTLFNAGTRHPQMSSCYLLTVAEDSLEGIYKAYADCARLSKWAGGIGIDWTGVRATGAPIRGNNGTSSGLVPFLKVLDSSVHAVNQGGKRKGAAAVYLQPWHADIEAFLELRQNTGAEERRTHHLNLALWVPDLFMRRVATGEDWSLFDPAAAPELTETWGAEFEAHYERLEREGRALKTVSARALYARMLQNLAETGNGWLCFKDTANARSAQTGAPGNLIRSSNLCTEILEVTSGAETAVCNLGSINLAAFVADGAFDFDALRRTVRAVVPALDRVIDRNFYPTPEAAASNRRWRPVGLGMMGLQDALFQLRLPFASPEARALSNRIAEVMAFEALGASLGRRFPAYAESRYPDGTLQMDLARALGHPVPALHEDWDALRDQIRARGVGNSLLLAIAPTATIASIVGATESVEPLIANLFKRETLSGEFVQINRYLVRDLQARGLWTASLRERLVAGEGSIQHLPEVPDDLKALYLTAWELPQKALIDMAAERSAFICQGQSLNLFVEAPTIGKLSSMYMYAWKQGLKTTYYLRSRAKTRIQKATVQEAPAAIACSLANPERCEACE